MSASAFPVSHAQGSLPSVLSRRNAPCSVLFFKTSCLVGLTQYIFWKVFDVSQDLAYAAHRMAECPIIYDWSSKQMILTVMTPLPVVGISYGITKVYQASKKALHIEQGQGALRDGISGAAWIAGSCLVLTGGVVAYHMDNCLHDGF